MNRAVANFHNRCEILGLRNFITCEISQVTKILGPFMHLPLHQKFDKNSKNKHIKIKKICRKMKINLKTKINSKLEKSKKKNKRNRNKIK